MKPRLAIIGAGWLGGTVGQAWARSGYEVMFASRHPEQLVSMTKKLGPNASVGSLSQAAEFGTILLFAVPGDSLRSVAEELKKEIAGKIVLDATNTSASDNAAESAKSLSGARLVRAFCAVDATEIESSSKRSSRKLAVPLASDDAEAMEVAAELVRAAGCDPVIVGNLASAKSFQRGAPGFRAHLGESELRKRLGISN